MFNLPTNINKRERIVRGVLGVLLLIGAIVGLGTAFALIIGLLLIAEAALNYCGIIDLIDRLKIDTEGTTTTNAAKPNPNNNQPKPPQS